MTKDQILIFSMRGMSIIVTFSEPLIFNSLQNLHSFLHIICSLLNDFVERRNESVSERDKERVRESEGRVRGREGEIITNFEKIRIMKIRKQALDKI